MKSTSPGSGSVCTVSASSAALSATHASLAAHCASEPALVIARCRSTLQLPLYTAASGLLSLNASAAGFQYSIAHLVVAARAWCMPSDSPPQPAQHAEW